jgi:hypothetical protein
MRGFFSICDTGNLDMSMNLRRVGAWISMVLIGALLFGCEGESPDASTGSSASAGSAAAGTTSGTTSGTTAGTTSGTTAPATSGTATVSWTAPQVDINGMTSVAGYRIYYGSAAGELTHVIDVDDAAALNYTVGNLAPGVWYFAVADYDVQKIESPLSGVVQVTI